MTDIVPSGDLIQGDYLAGSVDGIWAYLTPSKYGNHDAIASMIERFDVLGSPAQFDTFKSNTTVPLHCGCYDGEGLKPISPLFDLSPCFTNGVLVNLLSLYLLISGSIQIYRLRRLKNIKARSTAWFPLKMGLILLQIVFQLALVIATANYSTYSRPDISYTNDIKFWSTVGNFAVLFIAILLSYIENYKTFVSSTSLIVYWGFSAIVGGFRIINASVRSSPQPILQFTVLTTINTLFIELLEIYAAPELIPDPTVKYNIYDYSNIFAKITFSWLTPLMQKGYSKFLDQTDLPPLPNDLQSKTLASTLEHHWNNELNYKSKPSLGWALSKSFGGPFVVAGFFKLIQDCMAFVQPQLLKRLIMFANDYKKDKDTPLLKGFMIVIAMFGISVIQTASLHQYFERVFNTGMRIRSSMTSLIYRKSLVLSVESKQKKSSGDIVNLMSVDTQRLQDLCQNLNIIWSGPFQITLCLISLYNLLGNAMWIGVIVLIVTVPLNTFIFRKQKELQKKQMKVKDERTSIISEILNNMKSLKLYAWELPYREKLTYVRNEKELKNLKTLGIFQAGFQFIFNNAPYLVSFSTFALFILFNKDTPLSTDIVFTALSLFNLLGFPLAVIPWTVGNIIEAQVSLKRLTDFLTGDELNDDSVNKLPTAQNIGDVAVKIEDADFLWTRDPYKVALTRINYVAKKGELSCVIGRVGSGKSAILQALLGDLHKPKGLVFLHGSIAYVPQVPWIMNGTIKGNILFGCKYDPEFYNQTIKACALTHDLSVLPDGDLTQVGEKGISLSGGQKARLSLARAVYARADVYILDDILSAVDEHVGKHLINNVLGPDGLLTSRCRILATNNLNVLRFSNHISMIDGGRIIEEGAYDDIVAKDDSKLASLIAEFGNKKNDTNDKEESIVETSYDREPSDDTYSEPSDLDEEIKKASETELRKAEIEDYEIAEQLKEAEQFKSGRDEKHEQGKVSDEIYKLYAKACGIRNVILFLIIMVLTMALTVVANIWLKHWSEVNSGAGYNPEPLKYLGIYLGICLSSSTLLMCQTLIQWLLCSISGSKYLHQIMLDSVLKAPMQFFETTPIGRILNRFSNDIYKIDENLFRVFAMFFNNATKVTFTMLVIIYSTWQFIFLILPLALLYKFYQKYYLATSRELRRLDSVSRSPIFAHFQETLSGVATIRAYGQLNRFSYLNRHKVDVNMSAFHPSVSSNRWLAVRLEFLGSLVILGASGLLILTLKSGHVTPGLVGLSVSYALQITQSLNWIVRMTVDIESNIVSVERVYEYSKLKPEAPSIIEDKRPASKWPFNGVINFKDYSTRYRDELGLVLKNINLTINPKEKIGIVGRTGAGKSSLTLALFRIIEAAQGNIVVDEVKTDEIGLYDLRSRLSIIPQDSQIFEGTIRSNLDPTNQYTDEDLLKALELSHLKSHVLHMYEEYAEKDELSNNPLNVKLSEGGSNLSVGQRQLMCLARALVKDNCKILVLDEATANVDIETDSIVQETIRGAFKERTILTIAHRLNTIIDSDRIIVLEKGEVAEFDTPANLLKKKDSLFYSLCKEGGLIDHDE